MLTLNKMKFWMVNIWQLKRRHVQACLPSQSFHPTQQAFLEDLTLYIIKGHCPLSIVEDAWLKHMVLWQCEKVVFPFRNQLVYDVLPNMVTKTMEKWVNSKLTKCIMCTTTFDLWMS